LDLEDHSMQELDEEPLPSPTQLYFEDLSSQRDDMDFAGMSINSWLGLSLDLLLQTQILPL
jgi:hypothetical protein